MRKSKSVAATRAVGASSGRSIQVPVIEEGVQFDKRVVDSGGYRISKRVTTRQETVDEVLRDHRVVVERRPIGQLEQAKTQAKAKARQIADDAASASSKAALGAVLALVLGAVAAALDGMSARRRVDVVTDRPITSRPGEYTVNLPR